MPTPADSRCGCPPSPKKLQLNLGDPQELNVQCKPAQSRTFLADSFAFGYAPRRLFRGWCLRGLRRQRQNINWWVRRRRGWSIRHRVQQRSQTAGRKGWKFWLLKLASSRDPHKGLGHLEGPGAWPEPLGGHRSYQELAKVLIKQRTRQTRAEG